MEKIKYEFEMDFASKTAVAVILGRFDLWDGSTIRLFFTPKGLTAFINKSTKNAKDVVVYNNVQKYPDSSKS